MNRRSSETLARDLESSPQEKTLTIQQTTPKQLHFSEESTQIR